MVNLSDLLIGGIIGVAGTLATIQLLGKKLQTKTTTTLSKFTES